MQQAASALGVSDAVVRRLIAQKTLPAKQIVKFAPRMIERAHLNLPAVHRAVRLVHTVGAIHHLCLTLRRPTCFCSPEDLEQILRSASIRPGDLVLHTVLSSRLDSESLRIYTGIV